MSQDIELVKIEMKGFLSYVKKTTIPLGRDGLVLIDGKNNVWGAVDSNGVGKTNIAHSICWNFFGKTLDGEGGDKVLNENIPGSAWVQLTVKVGNDVFTIDRYQGHKEHKNNVYLKCGDRLIKGADKSDTQSKINGLLGMDFETFVTAVVVEEFPFTGSSDADQKKVLDKIQGLTGLQKARKFTAKKVANAKEAVKNVGTKIEEYEERLEAVKSHLTEIQENSSSFSESKESRLTSLREELDEELKKLKKLQSKDYSPERESLKEKIESLAASITSEKKLGEEQTELETQKATLRSELGADNRAITDLKHKCMDLEQLKGECDKCEQAIPKGHIPDRLEYYTKEIKSLEKKVNKMNSKYRDLSDSLEEVRERLETLQQRKDKLEHLKEKSAELQLRSKDDKHKIEIVQNNIATLKEQIENIDQEEDPYEELKAKTTEEKASLLSKLSGFYDKEKKLQKGFSDLKFCERAFSNSGIRSYLYDSVAAKLSSYTNDLSKKISDGKIQIKFMTQQENAKGEKIDKFHVKVTNHYGSKRYRRNSKGEKKRVDACVMLALNMLARTRTSRRIRFLLLDEFLDGLDKTGRERMIKLLKEIAKDCLILVITHEQDMRPYFHRVIQVTKNEEYISTIS